MYAKKPKPVQQYFSKTHTTTPSVPDAILPHLYLTDIFTARGVLQPSYAGPGRPVIRYILSALDNSIDQPRPKPLSREDEFVQKLIIIDDTSDSDLLAVLTDTCNFIRDSIAKDDGGVLVHCHLGQSRSAAIVIAYVMRKDKSDYQAAFEKVKKRRSSVKPNPGFQKQLQLWADMEYDIHDADGNPKESYSQWKTEQKERVKRILDNL